MMTSSIFQPFKKIIITTIKIIAAFFIIKLLMNTSQIQFPLLTHILQAPLLTLSSICMFLLMIFISSWRWRLLNLTQQIKLGWLETIWITYLGTAFNNVLPGNIGGDIVRGVYLFKIVPEQRSNALLAILFDRIIGLMGIFLAICLAAIFQLSLFTHSQDLQLILIFCTGFCICSLGVFALSILLPQKIGVSVWLNQHFGEKRWAKLIISLLEAMRIYRNAKIVILKCLIASISIQLCMLATVFLLAKAMNFSAISLTSYLVAICVTQIANLIPATPGGLGIGEAAFSKILLLMNPALPAAYATIFIAYRLIGIIIYLPGILWPALLSRKNNGKQQTQNDYPITSHP